MLVRFSSKSQSISMHEADAKQMIKMMGMSGTIPSAVDEESLPAALKALQDFIEQKNDEDMAHLDSIKQLRSYDDKYDEYVSTSVRAQPLIDMLKSAKNKSESVMWEFQS